MKHLTKNLTGFTNLNQCSYFVSLSHIDVMMTMHNFIQLIGLYNLEYPCFHRKCRFVCVSDLHPATVINELRVGRRADKWNLPLCCHYDVFSHAIVTFAHFQSIHSAPGWTKENGNAQWQRSEPNALRFCIAEFTFAYFDWGVIVAPRVCRFRPFTASLYPACCSPSISKLDDVLD